MGNDKYIAYYRVSTQKQGNSGLGLEAQKHTVSVYLKDALLINEYIEIESGKNNDRPELQAALNECQITGASLIIARLDRLSRSVGFMDALLKSGVKFVACDNPTANKFTVHIIAAVNEQESEYRSITTREALSRAKARGMKLGTDNLTAEGRIKGNKKSIRVRGDKADRHAELIFHYIEDMVTNSTPLYQIAQYLNTTHLKTPGMSVGKWHAQTVKNIIKRVKCKR